MGSGPMLQQPETPGKQAVLGQWPSRTVATRGETRYRQATSPAERVSSMEFSVVSRLPT